MKSFVSITEVTRVLIFEESWKMVQELWLGRGKVELNKVSKSSLVLHSH